MPAERPAAVELEQLVTCPHALRGLSLRACLRRQVELVRHTVVEQSANEASGARRKTSVKLGGPAHPECQGCPLGAPRLEAADRAGVEVKACGRCGTGLVGAAACDDCAAEKPAGAGDVPTMRAPTSVVIWGEGAPNAPLSAPGPRDTRASAMAEALRARLAGEKKRAARAPQAASAPAPQVLRNETAEPQREERAPQHASEPAAQPPRAAEPPASPAQENPMAGHGGAHAPCPECGSKTRHRKDCSKPPRAGAPARKPADVVELDTTAPPIFAKLTVDELVAQRDNFRARAASCDAELRRRADVIAKALAPGRREEAA